MEKMCERRARQLEENKLDIHIKEMHAHMRGTELEQKEEELRELELELEQHHLFSTDSSSSHNTGSSEPYANVFDTYMPPDPSQMVHDMECVYEWENPDFYNILV
jgi:hypothetical protein